MIAFFGLVAYPGQGICKTLYSLAHSRAKEAIVGSRIAEGEYLVCKIRDGMAQEEAVLRNFEALFPPKKKLFRR